MFFMPAAPTKSTRPVSPSGSTSAAKKSVPQHLPAKAQNRLPPGSACGEAGLPDLRPCFLLKWGDGASDQFETEDFEIVVLAVCNPYSNIAFGKICLYNLRAVKADGSPVDNLPDGTPTVMIVPSREVCVCEVGPCSCAFVELAIKTSGATEGGFRILFDYCIEEIKLPPLSGAGAFNTEMLRS
jgi:hypothetical protein